MATPTAVINVVGLSESLIGGRTPHISALVGRGRLQRLRPVLPAVTCSVQSSMLTGVAPREHGIVGNGWYDRALGEVHFWKQSNRLVGAEKVWETARRHDPAVTCANLFWWYNMHTSADFSVTPRPQYRADGRKIPDVYTAPADLRPWLQAELGRFPLFHFWGPAADITSSRWIADAARLVHARHRPTLTLVYLPHLDYALQKLGPADPRIGDEAAAIDAIVGDLIAYFEAEGVRIILLSEYGIEAADGPVHVNRSLRDAGGVAVREENGRELLDPAASKAFAVADHQVAHVYVRDEGDIDRYADLCRGIDGVEQVLPRAAQADHAIDHPRAGDLVLVADPGRWFSSYHWRDDRRAPDFARTVDIHRKPGYDPVELFLDPGLPAPKAAIAWRLLKRRLGFRTLMDVIPLDATLVRGTHGRVTGSPDLQPILVTPSGSGDDELPCTAVRDVILEHLLR